MAAFLALGSFGTAFAQTPNGVPEIHIDAPVGGATVYNGVQIDVGGWALDPGGPGTGVDMVQVSLDGPNQSPNLLGNATYGKPRPDVGLAKNNPADAGSGYDYLWTPMNLSPGQHILYVWAHSIAHGWASQSITINGAGSAGYGGGSPYEMNQYEPGTPYRGSYLTNTGYGGAPYGPPPCSPYMPPSPLCPPPVLLLPPPPPLPPVRAPIGTLTAPTNVMVGPVTSNTIALTWTAVPGATSYLVLASAGSTGIYLPAAVMNQTTTGTVVSGLTPATMYSLRVVAMGPHGQQSPPSTTVTAMTAP